MGLPKGDPSPTRLDNEGGATLHMVPGGFAKRWRRGLLELRRHPTRSEPAEMSTLPQTLWPASVRRLVGATGFVPAVRLEHASEAFVRVPRLVECVAVGLFDYVRQDAYAMEFWNVGSQTRHDWLWRGSCYHSDLPACPAKWYIV